MEFPKLPNKIVQHIFSFLDHKSRMTILEVCRKWNAFTFTTQFMDRIWLRLNMAETNFILQVATLRISFRNYRHVVIDCRNSVTPILDQLAEIFPVLCNVETLALFGIENLSATEFLTLLKNVPKLTCLHLIQDKINTLPHDLSQLKTVDDNGSDASWRDIFTKSTIALNNVNEVMLILPRGCNINVEYFQQMLPNVTQLNLTVNHPSIVNLIDAYKYQLERFSIHAIPQHLFAMFCYISFPRLSHFNLNLESTTMTPTDRTRLNNFFKCPDHARNLRQLKLFPTYTSIMQTICSYCTSLRVLEVSVTNINFIKNISILTNLQKLLIQKSTQTPNIIPTTVEFCDDPTYYEPLQPFEYDLKLYHPIQSLKEVEICGSFLPTLQLLTILNNIAPNLEVLCLKNVGEPEITLQTLSETFPKVRHLELHFMPQSGKPPCLNFGYLLNKIKLVTLFLANIILDGDGVQKWIQLAPNVSKITLARCETLTDAHLATFGTSSSSCGKLKQLELKNCTKITAEGLEAFRKNAPHVTITCESRVK